MVENRRVGIKSREIYECPAALALIAGARGSRGPDPRARPAPREGPPRAALGRARLRRALVLAPAVSPAGFHRREPAPRHRRGAAAVRRAGHVHGRRPAQPVALYDHDLATYDASDTFRHADAEGFVRLWGLGVATWSASQGPGADGGTGAERPASGGRTSSAPREGGRAMTLWEGRIAAGMADEVAEFTVSLPFDQAPGARRPGRARGRTSRDSAKSAFSPTPR